LQVSGIFATFEQKMHRLLYRFFAFCLLSAALVVVFAFVVKQEDQPGPNRADEISPDSLMGKANEMGKLQPDSAIFYYEKAALGFQKQGAWAEWFDCINKVRDLYKTARKYQASIDYMRKASHTALTQIGETDTITAKVFTRLGTAYDLAGKYDSALIAYSKAVSVFEKYRIEDGTVATLQKNIGNIYGRRMDYQQATDHLGEALRIRLQLSDHAVAARIYNDLGVVYQNWKDFPKALDQYNLALKLISPDDVFQAVVQTNIAASYQGLGLFEQALKNLNQALNRFIVQYGPEHEYVSAVYLSIAQIAQEQGQTEEAIGKYETALSIAQKLYGNKHRDLIRIYTSMAEVYAEKHQFLTSLHYQQQSLIALLPSFNDTSVLVNPSEQQFIPDPWLFDVLQSKGELWQQQYRLTPDTVLLQHALNCFGLASRHINYMRRNYSSELSKLKLADLTYHNFEQALKVVVEQYRISSNKCWIDTALLFSEQFKAAVLLESVKDNEARLFADIPPDLLERDLQLRETLAQTEQQLFDLQQQKASPDTLNKINKQLFELRKQNRQLNSRIEQDYPGFARLKYETNTPGSKDIIEHLLDDKTGFIEYFTADSAIYAIVISKQQSFLAVLDKDKGFDSSIDTLRSLLSDPGLAQRQPDEAYRSFCQNAYYLYQTLLREPLSRLPEEISRLVIVTDGILGYLPFEALLTGLPEVSQPDFRNLTPHYLIQRYAISYGASATLLLEQQATRSKRASELFAAFAPSYSQPDSLTTAQNKVAELKGAAAEVRQISELTGGRVLSGNEASKTNFKNQAEQYQILHLAMHGTVNDENPMYSYLLFTQTPATPNDYARLHTYELYTMNLNADLAVLSACSTGEGKAQHGEGIMSLSRGFIYAGCPAIVMSLWKAADNGTQKIMTFFYQNLLQNQLKDIALQQAKLRFLTDADRITANPFYWATFVLLGNAQPIPTGYSFTFWALSIFALIGLFAAFFRIWRKNGFKKLNIGG